MSSLQALRIWGFKNFQIFHGVVYLEHRIPGEVYYNTKLDRWISFNFILWVMGTHWNTEILWAGGKCGPSWVLTSFWYHAQDRQEDKRAEVGQLRESLGFIQFIEFLLFLDNINSGKVLSCIETKLDSLQLQGEAVNPVHFSFHWEMEEFELSLDTLNWREIELIPIGLTG